MMTIVNWDTVFFVSLLNNIVFSLYTIIFPCSRLNFLVALQSEYGESGISGNKKEFYAIAMFCV